MEESVSIPKFNLNIFLNLLKKFINTAYKNNYDSYPRLEEYKKNDESVGHKNYQYAAVEFVKKIIIRRQIPICNDKGKKNGNKIINLYK